MTNAAAVSNKRFKYDIYVFTSLFFLLWLYRIFVHNF